MPDLAAAPAAPVTPTRSVTPVATPEPALSGADLRALRAAVTGRVLVPGDPGYDEARGIHNTHFLRQPAVVVRPESAVDVSRAVTTARELGLEIAVKGGGHSVAGHSSTDGLLIDLGAMRAIDIDPVRGIGSAQGGATAGEYTAAAGQHGFATPFGDTGSVGLGGLTLGGGIGWLARKHGLTIDSLVEVDLVTADGRLVTVSEAADPDLFWAVRGGGGNFGVATRFRYRLHPVDIVTGGMLVLPLTPQVLRDLVDALVAAPEELTQITFVMGLPPAPFVPPQARRHAGRHRHAGPRGLARRRHRRDGAVPRDRDAARRHGRPDALPGDVPAHRRGRAPRSGRRPVRVHARTSTTRRSTRSSSATTARRAPCAMTQLRILGGAAGRVPAAATAFAHRDATVMASVIAHGEGDDQDVRAYAEAYHADLSGGATGVYANFVGDEAASRIHAAYPGATYERLVQVKRRVDPENVFHANHNIRPD